MKRYIMPFFLVNILIAGALIANLGFQSSNGGNNLWAPVVNWWNKVNTVDSTPVLTKTNQVPLVPTPTMLTSNITVKESPTLPATVDTPVTRVSPDSYGSASVNTDSNDLAQSLTNTKVVPVIAPVAKPVVTTELKAPAHAPVCVTYGPMNLEQKASLDVILIKYKLSNSSTLVTSKEPLYQIDWNLGSDKVNAVKLFEVQKNDGPLQDEKFKLTQNDNGDWVVPITTVANDQIKAQTMTTELAQAANSHKAGGKWEWKTVKEGYFYQFKDLTSFPSNVVDMINHTISTVKTPC